MADGKETAEEKEYRHFSDFYKRMRDQVEHENTLYNQRIVWLITMQAFLFATLGLLMQAKVAETTVTSLQINCFRYLICFVGLAVALISERILSDARNALKHLRDHWDQASIPAPYEKFFPHVNGGSGKATDRTFRRSRNLPMMFCVVWVIAMVIFAFGPQTKGPDDSTQCVGICRLK
jgi:hypothetical protein